MKTHRKILLTALFFMVVTGLVLSEAEGMLLAQGPGKSPDKKGQAKKQEGEKPTKGNALKGKAVYEEYCAICHFSASSEKKIGPGLKGIFRFGKFSDGKKVDDKSMRAWIENGGVDMPAFKDSLTVQEISNLIAFLRTL